MPLIVVKSVGGRAGIINLYATPFYPDKNSVTLTYVPNVSAGDSVLMSIKGGPVFMAIPITNLDIGNLGTPVANNADFEARTATVFPNAGGGAGTVTSVTGVSVNNADPTNPVVGYKGTSAQRNALVGMAFGCQWYQTDANEGLYLYKSIGWVFVA